MSLRSARRAAAASFLLVAGFAVPASAKGPPPAPPAPPAASAAEQGPVKATTVELTLTVGETKTIPTQNVTSYTVGAPGIVELKVTPDLSQFVFVGTRSGTTTVLMIKKGGQEVTYVINVYARAPGVVEQELGELLTGYTGLRIRRVGTRFFIEGGVANDADARRIQLIANLYPGQVESLVVVGSVGVEHTIDVRIDFYFVQYNKNSNYGVGVSWPGRIGPGSVHLSKDLLSSGASATASLDQPLPALDIAQTRGWAKVLKHSTVVTTSGSEAAFDSGGEQNFAIAAGLTSSVQAIKFGTNVTVLPRYDAVTKDLEVKVAASISDLTAPAGTTSLPGRQTSNVTTFVHLKLGQSLVLSGIQTRAATHSVTGIPGLSQIPLLGVLFGGHTNSTDEVEGAVFIIPSLVESSPRRAHDIVDVAMKQYEEFSGDIEKPTSFAHDPPAYKK